MSQPRYALSPRHVRSPCVNRSNLALQRTRPAEAALGKIEALASAGRSAELSVWLVTRQEIPPMPEFRVKRSKSTENLPEVIELLASAGAEAANTASVVASWSFATRGQRLLCGYYFYWDDVTNGGHLQYFGNYNGQPLARGIGGGACASPPRRENLGATRLLSFRTSSPASPSAIAASN